MYLSQLTLEEFRSYRRLELALEPPGLRLAGANASGKSTLLEAIAMLATTRSPRSNVERETINWASGADVGFPPFARVKATVIPADGPFELEITLQVDPARPSATKKQIKLDGRVVRAMDAVGRLKAVLFSPEDVTLISGPPSERRRYLDLTISQIDGRYLRALARFVKILTQRNSLLKALARDRVPARSPGADEQLAFWNGEIVAVAARLVATRQAIVTRLATLAAQRFRWLSDGGELEIIYRPSFNLAALDRSDGDQGDATLIVAREFESALELARDDDLRRGVTTVGPHRDDVGFAVDGVDLAAFGSRGQQRLAVVALKLAEVDLMTEVAGEPPVLLLDDVLSELDADHRALLAATAAQLGGQLFVTATDRHLLDVPELKRLPAARVSAGEITVTEPEPEPIPAR
jgi:DNA replication and repair protein RecF